MKLTKADIEDYFEPNSIALDRSQARRFRIRVNVEEISQ